LTIVSDIDELLFIHQMSQVMDSITKELQLKETEEELLNRRMEQTEQKEVSCCLTPLPWN